MSTKNTDTVVTVSPELRKAFDAFVDARDARDEAETKFEEATAELNKVCEAQGGKTFEIDGVYHQIRMRANQPYLVTLKSRPEEWLKASRDKKAEEAAKEFLRKKGINPDALEGVFTSEGSNPGQDAVDATVGEQKSSDEDAEQNKGAIVL